MGNNYLDAKNKFSNERVLFLENAEKEVRRLLGNITKSHPNITCFCTIGSMGSSFIELYYTDSKDNKRYTFYECHFRTPQVVWDNSYESLKDRSEKVIESLKKKSFFINKENGGLIEVINNFVSDVYSIFEIVIDCENLGLNLFLDSNYKPRYTLIEPIFVTELNNSAYLHNMSLNLFRSYEISLTNQLLINYNELKGTCLSNHLSMQSLVDILIKEEIFVDNIDEYSKINFKLVPNYDYKSLNKILNILRNEIKDWNPSYALLKFIISNYESLKKYFETSFTLDDMNYLFGDFIKYDRVKNKLMDSFNKNSELFGFIPLFKSLDNNNVFKIEVTNYINNKNLILNINLTKKDLDS